LKCELKFSIFSVFLLLFFSSNISINPQTSNILRTVNLDGSDVVAVSISESGGSVYAATSNSNLFSYHPTSNTFQWEQHLEGEIEQIVASSDNHYAVARTSEKVYLFDWNGNILYNLSSQSLDVDISADGNYFICVDYPDQKLICYNISSSTVLWTYDFFSLTNAEISVDGNFIVASSALGDVFLFNNTKDTPTSERIEKRFGSEALIFDISSKVNETYLVTIGLNNGSILLVNKMAEIIWMYSPEVAFWAATSIEISDDGNIVVVGTSNLKIYLFHGSNVPSYTFSATNYIVGTFLIDMNRKATYFAAGSELGTVYLFSTDRRCATPIITHPFGEGVSNYDAILSIAIDSQQDRIAAGCRNDNLYIIERGTAFCEEATPMIYGFEPLMIIIICLGLSFVLYIRFKIRNKGC
jgi:hypothetical protein